MAMNSSGMTGKIALKKEEFQEKREELQEKREEHREKYEAKKEAFNEKYEVPVSERPSLARLTKADIFKLVGLGLFFCAYGGRVRAYRAVDCRAFRARRFATRT